MRSVFFIYLVSCLLWALPSASAQRGDAFTRKGEVNVCSGDLRDTDWSFRYARFIHDGSLPEGNLKPVAYLDPFHECSNKRTQKKRIVPTETAVTPGAHVRIEGPLCAASPTIVLGGGYRATFFEQPVLTTTNITSYGAPGRVVDVMSSTPAALYLGDASKGNANLYLKGHLNAVRNLIAQECGTLPETMRVSGRHKFSPAVIKEGLPPRQKITSGTYAYEEYYSGTFFPRETGFVFEHDLDEQVILFDVLTGKYNDAMARRYKYDPDKAALGLGAIALAVIGIHAGGVGGSGAAGVCLDASIPLAERLAMGC